MKGLPAVAWILGGFVIMALLLIVYAKTGGDDVPYARSVWTEIDRVCDEIRSRKFDLHVGDWREDVRQPYRFQLRRLGDTEGSDAVAKYLLSVRFVAEPPVPDPWIGSGVDLAVLDLSPGEVFGTVRVVSFRRVDTKL